MTRVVQWWWTEGGGRRWAGSTGVSLVGGLGLYFWVFVAIPWIAGWGGMIMAAEFLSASLFLVGAGAALFVHDWWKRSNVGEGR